MNDVDDVDERTEQQQQRWLAAARRHHGPSPAAVRRMHRGLRARIEAGEPAPAWEVAPAEASASRADAAGVRTQASRWRPWIVGAGVLLAAAAVLIWLGRGPERALASKSEPNAAQLDAAPRQGATATERASGTVAAPAAPVVPPSVHVPAPDPVAEPLRASSDPARSVGPASRAPVRSPVVEPAPEPAASEKPVALDVAGEAAVLRRAKAAIERAAWDEAATALDAYAHEHPAGVLAPEARALQVVVACGRGANNASARAEEHLQRHPDSPLRERIQRACAIDRAP